MVVKFFNRAIPNECHLKMREYYAAGNDIICVAFPSGGGDRWSIITKSGSYTNNNIPAECHTKMAELSQGGAKLTLVAFTPSGGWSVINDQGAYFNRNIPASCHAKMAELSLGVAKISFVAFTPSGGWSVVNDQGVYFNSGTPTEFDTRMGEMSAGGAKIICVAFPPVGGNSWSIINNRGGYFNRNIAEEAHMFMGYFSNVYGPLQFLAYDTDGSGWSIITSVTINEKVSDAKGTVAIADVYENVAARLGRTAVGYACTVGRARLSGYSHGEARTSANPPARTFLPSTKIPVASVSKVVTTLAAIRVLANRGVSLNAAIGRYLPSDWAVNPNVGAITFRQLLSQHSGVRDYGNNDQSYATLKAFFTQNPLDLTKLDPSNKSYAYSNTNFGIFRILLPIVNGFTDSDPPRRAELLAAAYVRLVQRLVFEPVGAVGVDSKPPATDPQSSAYAFSYKYPGSTSGFDWGDTTTGVGGVGWYLAIDDIAKVLQSLNSNDGRILTPAQLADMEATPLGWDTRRDGAGYRWVQKNGGWGSWNGTSITTSIALFGPGVFGALFINSDILGPGLQNNWRHCTKCHALSFAGNANMGLCPAGPIPGREMHTHDGSANFCLSNASTGTGQPNWRWCNKCQALAFAGSSTGLGPCSGGGMHDHAGSGNYALYSAGGEVPEDGQDGWKWCWKCQVLCYGDGGPCGAGGTHDHAGSGNYRIEYVVSASTVLYEAYMKALKPAP